MIIFLPLSTKLSILFDMDQIISAISLKQPKFFPQKDLESFGETIGVADFAVCLLWVITEGLAVAHQIRCDNWEPAGHVFDDCVRQALVRAVQYPNIAGSQEP